MEFAEDDEITLISSNKLNGFNVQISYDKVRDQFIICSKNSFQVYHQEEYEDRHSENIFKEKINNQFRNYLLKHPENIDKLKGFLADHTFVGEYVGGVFNQHITQESEEKIVYYTVTRKNTFVDDILSFEESSKVYSDFGLDFVKYDSFTGKLEQIVEQVRKMNENCIYQSLDEVGEGYVLYFEVKGKVKYMCKLKSVSYIIDRALREFCRSIFKSQQHGERVTEELATSSKKKLLQRLNQYPIKEEKKEEFAVFVEKKFNEVFQGVISGGYNPENWIYHRFNITTEENKKPLVFICPVGIPGMGKTYWVRNCLVPYFKKKDFKIYVLSSDEETTKLMGDISQMSKAEIS